MLLHFGALIFIPFVSVLGHGTYQPQQNDVYDFFPVSQNEIRFRVRAAGNASIVLSEIDEVVKGKTFEITIGGSWYKKCNIRLYKTYSITTIDGDYLDQNTYRGFWIRWKSNSLEVGLENDKRTPIIAYHSKNPFNFKILFFGINSFGARADWLLQPSSATQVYSSSLLLIALLLMKLCSIF